VGERWAFENKKKIQLLDQLIEKSDNDLLTNSLYDDGATFI
jgi:hypothetical protein